MGCLNSGCSYWVAQIDRHHKIWLPKMWLLKWDAHIVVAHIGLPKLTEINKIWLLKMWLLKLTEINKIWLLKMWLLKLGCSYSGCSYWVAQID